MVENMNPIGSNSNEKYAIFTLVGYRDLSQMETNIKLEHSITAFNNSNGNHQFSLEEDGNRLKKSFQNDKSMIIQSEMNQFKSKKSPLIVVAIDFGTTYTGYAFVFKNDKDQIHYMKKNYGLHNQNKVPTTLLLDHRKQFHSFGYEAKNFFYNLDCKKSSKFYYFENFKMNLYQEKLLKKFKLNSLNHPNEMFDAMRIFTMSLEYLCSQALKEIGDQCSITLTKDDIAWVITVPAIWSNSSKQFMRMAAEKTDLICNDSLKIALEPEVASLYCRKYLSDEYRLKSKEDKRSSTEKDDLILKSGTKYLIVDFGGGTVDITVHHDQSNGFIKEIHKSTGGPFGSNEINKQFEDILGSIFGIKLWTKFKKELPSTYLDLMQTFEIRKQEARPDRNTAYNILLTYSFINFFKPSIIEDLFDRKAPNGIAFSSKLGIIRIDAPLMRKLFHKVIEPTIKIIQSLLEGPLRLHQIDYVFLVGGFAQSLMLKQAFRSVFEPKFNVIVPNQAQLAVLYGACQYGLNPTLIQSRRVMKTYGIAVLVKFDSTIHPEEKRITKDGLHWCSDVFDRFVTINQSIGIFESIKRKYKPIFSTQTSCIFQIYCTESAEVRFVTDPGVIKCGTLYLELDQIQFPDNVNPAIKELFQREIEVEMFFGETEIKFSAKDLRTGYMVKNVVDFLSKIE